MAFSIEGLTNVINKYLNSVSDTGKAINEANVAAENRRVFRDTLGEAIKAQTQKSIPEFPDIQSLIQQNMESRMRVDTTFSEASTVAATSAASSSDSASSGNADAFKGQLSTEALQELAKSAYFSTNLIRSDLFNESGDNSSSSSSLDSGNSLSDLNAKYLLASYLNNSKSTDAVTSLFGDFSL